jgi:hypothetical protein
MISIISLLILSDGGILLFGMTDLLWFCPLFRGLVYVHYPKDTSCHFIFPLKFFPDNLRHYRSNTTSPYFANQFTTSVEEEPIEHPKTFVLFQNYPNPFNPQTIIEYVLPKNTYVRLTLYNILGQKVKTLIDEYQSAGHRTKLWDGRDDKGNEVASGIYFYRLDAGGFTQVKKMLLLK